MKNFKILFVLCLFFFKGFGQNHLNLKEKNWVLTDTNLYEIKVVPSKKNESKTDVLFNAKKEIISYKIKKTYNFDNSKKINFEDLGIISKFKADFKLKEDKLFIYPWLYNCNNKNAEKINSYFDENLAYIVLEDRKNYSFKNSSYQLGVITIPIKMYLESELGNVNLNANAMLNLGFNFGKNKFVKFPNEEKARNYKSNYSINFLAGIASIELDDSNINTKGSAEGKVAAISTGLSFGVHYNNFSFMLASGFDLTTSNRKDWKFSGIPWLGVGIGIDFFKFK